MKKLLAILILLCACVMTAQATDIVISATTLPSQFQAGNLPATVTGTATVTNGSAEITSSAAFRNSWLNYTGFIINLGGTYYYVSSVNTTSSITLSTVYAGSNGTVSFTVYPFLILRFYSNISWTPLGATYIVQQGAPGSNVWFRQYSVSIIGTTVYLPTITLPSTINSATPLERSARFTAQFYSQQGGLVSFYGCFESFAIPTVTPTTWVNLCMYNRPGTSIPQNLSAYTTNQVDQLLAGYLPLPVGGGTVNQIVKFTPTGTAIGNSIISDNGAGITVAGTTTLNSSLTQVGTSAPSVSPALQSRIYTDVNGIPRISETGLQYIRLTRPENEVDVRQYTSFAAAVTAIGAANPKTLLISDAQTVAANVTVPTTVNLRFEGAGSLAVTSTFRVIIQGSIEAPPQQIFSGAGTVDFDKTNYFTGRLLEVYPQWWGALGNQVHDDTTAIQAAIDSLPRGKGTVRFPNGVYVITAPLTIIDDTEHNSRAGMTLQGDLGGASGTDNPSFIWNGATSTDPMLKLYSRDVTIRNIGFVLQGNTYKAVTAIDIDKATGTSPGTSTNNTLDGVRITATANNTVATGGITSAGTTLTTSGAFFASTDVGKYVAIEGAGASGLPLLTRITAFGSSTSVTVADAAGATVSSAKIVMSVLGSGVRIGNNNPLNCDLMKVWRSYIDYPAFASLYIPNTSGQTHEVSLTSNVYSFGAYGIFQSNANFQSIGDGFNTNYFSGVGLFSTNQTILIQSANSEHCPRILTKYGSSPSPWPVSVTSGRFSLTDIASDGLYIDFAAGGPLTLIGNYFEPGYVSTFKIKSTSTTPGGLIYSSGNHFPNQTPYTTAATNTRIVALGNHGYDSGSNPVILDDLFLTVGTATGGIATSLNPASAGVIRLGTTDTIQFRDNANTGNIAGLSKNTSDVVLVGDTGGTLFTGTQTNLKYAASAVDTLLRANGSSGSPTAVLSGETLGTLNFSGLYTTSVASFGNGAQILGLASGNFTASNDTPGKLEFWTNPGSGSGIVRSVSIESDQTLRVWDGGAGTKYFGFQVGGGAANQNWIMPATVPTANQVFVVSSVASPTVTTGFTSALSLTTVSASTSATIGSGTAITKVLGGSATLDFGSTGSGAVADLTITVTGAALNDACSVGVPNGSITATATFTCWVSATNTVSVRFSPKNTEDPASGTFTVALIRF